MVTQLSENFTLAEMLRSSTAERHPLLRAEQQTPPLEVRENLAYLATTTLQPIRGLLNDPALFHPGGPDIPLRVNSGYRSERLNKLIGGSPTSQHVKGEAGDIELSDRYKAEAREVVLWQRPDLELRDDCNANFYLFALICLNLEQLDVDQVIHEYGAPGAPAWVHVSASRRQNRRQILVVGHDTGRRYRELTVEAALALGAPQE